MYVDENTYQAASVEFARKMQGGPHKARMRFMGRGDTRTQMEFPASQEMECCVRSIDDVRAADCKKLAEKAEGQIVNQVQHFL